MEQKLQTITYDTNKLFQQFKIYLHKQNHIKKTTAPVGDGYKQLIDELKRQTQKKREKKQRVSCLLATISKQNPNQRVVQETILSPQVLPVPNQNAKFKLIRNFSAKNINSSRLISTEHLKKQKSQTKIQLEKGQVSMAKIKKLQKIEEQIMMIEFQKIKLSEDTNMLRNSLNKLTKQVQTAKRQVQTAKRNQEKFKHILYLTNSIQHETDNIKAKNSKGLFSMISKQEQALSSLKRFKSNLRKDKEDAENNYIQQINQWNQSQKGKNQLKQRQFLFQKKNKKVQKSIKLNYKLIDQIDSLIHLLKQKQENFQQIIQNQCSRVRLTKINKSLLNKEKINILNRIEQFQNKYNIKMESVQKLVLKVYRNISFQNGELEEKCLNLNRIKEEATKQYNSIRSKYDYQSQNLQNVKYTQTTLGESKKMQKIQRNSEMFIQVLNAFQMIMLKFRFMFSLALTLDVDKKLFRDGILQIDSLFKSGLFFHYDDEKQILSSIQKHDIMNEIQFAEILNMFIPMISGAQANELSSLLFNDKTTCLIIHKSWFLQKINSLQAKTSENMMFHLLNQIDQIRTNCNQIYSKKLHNIFRLFMQCINAVSMSKYQTKIAYSSTQRNSLFFPNNQNCKKQLLTGRDYQQQDEYHQVEQKTVKQIIFNEEDQKPKLIMEKDPLKIISELQKLKNGGKLKQINFNTKGKQYKYNQSIIIPNFTLQIFD